MIPALNVLLFVLLGFVHCQDPRKRGSEPLFLQNDEESSCNSKGCLKRSSTQDDIGPFWANRGKKDPSYKDNQLFVEEPQWILVQKGQFDVREKEPFFTSRGKKPAQWKNLGYYFDDVFKSRRDRRDYVDDVEPAFFAARGKRLLKGSEQLAD